MTIRSGAMVVAVVLASAAAATAGIAATAKSTHVTCTYKLTSLVPPTATKGDDFGFVRCGRPLGRGAHHDRFTNMPTLDTAGSSVGTFTDYFKTGTVHGRFKLTYAVAADGTATYTGTFRDTGGTGSFKHVKGSGKLTGTSPDGVHSTFRATGTLTGI
jgi:hypothetical protein